MVVPVAACAMAAWVAPASVVCGSALQALGAHHVVIVILGSVAAVRPRSAGVAVGPAVLRCPWQP